MLPLYIDVNPNHDASTTLKKVQTEFRIQAIPTSYEQDLLRLDDFMNGNLISVFTNLSLSDQQPLKYLKEASAMDDDFDIISKFEFKSTKRIKAHIRKAKYSPSIIID